MLLSPGVPVRRALASLVAVLATAALAGCADQEPSPAEPAAAPTSAPPTTATPEAAPPPLPVQQPTPTPQAPKQRRYVRDKEVWQRAQPAHLQNLDNPLAERRWGVYRGDLEQTWRAYESAGGETRRQLGKIALRPKSLWLGDWSGSPERIGSVVREYVENASGGDPKVLVQLAVFRMDPWEHAVCGGRAPSRGAQDTYRRWISNAARALGRQHTAVILQPDLPFWWCSNRAVTSSLITYAVKAFSAQPHTSVYLDAGAADWSSTPQTGAPRATQAADLLLANGIAHARGFALNATHYVGTEESVAYGAELARILRQRGVKGVHFVVDTAQNGNGMMWPEVEAQGSRVNDNARVCGSTADRRGCVTLGIPPTSRVGDPRWGLSPAVTREAKKYVDGFMWFARPWLFMQANWRGPDRALGMARSTRWSAP
ncbi:glycoside hydrolase family 6 protein [Nocardioides daeguensis]|uniref:Glucanase n=1 Tax=Nocardioides daeguensis TaxID=908359 RepID=A0ABP6WJC4_9ACTN|nr:glycoside hydrolase family 6 protein [Nocardioides daeguensis]MBV6729589.1 glycoside hydrolase family 6 protein [Nocardioides daeguensis]MCR1775021.1 glycoside hydrolase family 6 protein [Nocardioides daeguensis]